MLTVVVNGKQTIHCRDNEGIVRDIIREVEAKSSADRLAGRAGVSHLHSKLCHLLYVPCSQPVVHLHSYALRASRLDVSNGNLKLIVLGGWLECFNCHVQVTSPERCMNCGVSVMPNIIRKNEKSVARTKR